MRKTKLKILSILILISLLAFIGCNDDDLHSHNNEAKAGIKSSKITFKEFKKHTKAFNLVADVNKKQSESNNTSNKIVKDTVNNFTIDTQEGLYLQYANLHSFTFPIHREVDNGKLENLVLSYQNDGSYKVKILKYDLTPQEKADLELDQLKNIQNPIITIPIENFNTNLVVNGCETITETIWVSCGHGVHNSSNVTSWPSCTSDTPPRVYTVSRIKCIDAGDSTGGYDPNNGSLGWEPVGGDDSNYPPEYPTPQTDLEDYEEGISAPILNYENSLDIRNAGIFYRSLSFQQQQWVAENLDSYNQLIQYQINNYWSDESEVFAEELIDTSIQLEINMAEIWFNDYQTFRNQMSNSERAIFDNILPNRQMWYMGSAHKALVKSNEHFPNTFIPSNSHNGKGDAFRHALWNAYFTGFCGATLAEQLTTAHEENIDPLNPFPQKEIEMDLYNNHKGRLIASYSNVSNVTQNVLDYLYSGGLRYLNVLNPISPYYPTFYSTLIPTDQ